MPRILSAPKKVHQILDIIKMASSRKGFEFTYQTRRVQHRSLDNAVSGQHTSNFNIHGYEMKFEQFESTDSAVPVASILKAINDTLFPIGAQAILIKRNTISYQGNDKATPLHSRRDVVHIKDLHYHITESFDMQDQKVTS